MEALSQQLQVFMAIQNQQNQTQYGSGDEGLWGDDYREEPRRRCRPPVSFKEERRQDDRRMWESGIRIKAPGFQGSLQLEEFIDWLCTAKEVMEFKGVLKEIKVHLIVTRLRG